ncbi:MAG TPA: DUF5989 family protein [Opitutaceae bacterium]|jgi:hypothetical protein|nr:DUF5989 family protein [Opitutaceae bacterium]
MQSGYLLRLKIRRAREIRRRQVGLGLIGGWLLLLVGAFKWFYAANSSQTAAVAFLITGAVLLVAGLLRPSLLRPVESTLRAAGNWIGRGIFSVLLGVAYLCVITPVGLAMRVGRGSAPFYYGKGVTEGWTPKITDDRSPAGTSDNYRPLLLQPLVVFAYFIRLRRFILIPVLVFLLVAGLVLFFVKSSALAPLIYTLF